MSTLDAFRKSTAELLASPCPQQLLEEAGYSHKASTKIANSTAMASAKSTAPTRPI